MLKFSIGFPRDLHQLPCEGAVITRMKIRQIFRSHGSVQSGVPSNIYVLLFFARSGGHARQKSECFSTRSGRSAVRYYGLVRERKAFPVLSDAR